LEEGEESERGGLPRSTRLLGRSVASVIDLSALSFRHSDVGKSVRDLKLLETSSDVEELLETDSSILVCVDFAKDVTNSLVVCLESETSHGLAKIFRVNLSVIVGIEFSESLLESCEFVSVEDSSREVYSRIE
jgi:hypothetical protein